MSKPKLTPWFPSDSKPVRQGVYETELRGSFDQHIEFGYSFWNGVFWGNNRENPLAARNDGGRGMQDKPWRGRVGKAE